MLSPSFFTRTLLSAVFRVDLNWNIFDNQVAKSKLQTDRAWSREAPPLLDTRREPTTSSSTIFLRSSLTPIWSKHSSLSGTSCQQRSSSTSRQTSLNVSVSFCSGFFLVNPFCFYVNLDIEQNLVYFSILFTLQYCKNRNRVFLVGAVGFNIWYERSLFKFSFKYRFAMTITLKRFLSVVALD